MEQRFSDLIILLASGINQRRMYFDSHPRVQSISHEFVSKLRPMLEESGQDTFAFGVFSSKFIREGKYLVGPSIAGRSLIEFAEHLQCGGFGFSASITPEDLVTFFRLGAEQKDDIDNLETARTFFDSAGLSHIELAKTLSETGEDKAANSGISEPDETGAMDFMAADFAPLLQVYQSLYETVATNAVAINGDTRVDLGRARTRGEELVGVSSEGALDVMQFMRYPDFDSYTIGHSVRVAALCALMAKELDWPRELQNEMATAGLLHDLGKGKVPDEILFKPGRLDTDERRVMETHPVLGTRVLLANGESSPIVLAGAWGHHIREDGGGYPVMPAWFARSSAAALIHTCDVFEALTASRPYKNPMCPRQAYEIMLADKGAFQPQMLATLIRTMGLYPPGSEIVLSDCRRAVVVAKGQNMDQPMVRVTHDASGAAIRRPDQPAIDLQKEAGINVSEFLGVGVEEKSPSEAEITTQTA